jgi:predicted nucleic acid-binding protein
LPIFVDTGAWYALLDKSDSDHASAVQFNESLNHSIVTTNYVADEIITLTKARLGYVNAVEIGNKIWNETIATLIRVTPQFYRLYKFCGYGTIWNHRSFCF